jgi:hypothetical protein
VNKTINPEHNNTDLKNVIRHPPENRTTTKPLLLSLRLVLGFYLAALTVLLRIVLAFCIVLRVVLSAELTRFATTVSVILISMLSAALGARFTTFGAFLAATLALVLARGALSATLLALGTTRFGFLLLIGLRCAGLTLAHCDRKDSQEEGEQHNENSALTGFHFCSPIE